MKLLFAYRYGNLGGVSAQLLNRLAGFSKLGDVEVHLAFVEDHGLSAELDRPNLLFEESPKKIAAYCRRSGIDVVSVIDTPEVLDAVVSSHASRAVLLEVHTTYADRLEYLSHLPSGVDAVVVPSDYSENLVRGLVGASLPVCKVRNCVDPALFQPLEVARPPGPICLWVGKLDEHKNWRGFIEIAQRLLRDRPSLQFWMVGGSTASPEAKDALLQAIYRSTLSGRLRWLDFVSRASMPTLYSTVAASGGVSLVTSRNESFGMSIAESILCGCPVVATNVGAIPEICSNPDALSLYEFGDIERAAVLLRAVLDGGPRPRDEQLRWHSQLARTVSPEQVCDDYRKLANVHLRGR